MKICAKCGEGFPSSMVIEGKRRTFSGRRYCLECSPFKSHNTRKLNGELRKDQKTKTWTDEQLILAAKKAKSYADIIRELGLVTRGRSWATVQKHLKRLNINTDHIDGKTVALNKLLEKVVRTDEEVFCVNSSVSQGCLRRRLRKRSDILEYKCQNCCLIDVRDNEAFYNGKLIILQVDHINGVHNDNRIPNLRWLCANCHSQTRTFAGKTTRKVDRAV